MKDPIVLNRKIVPAETVLFKEGDIANTAYLLKKGRVEIWVHKKGGQEERIVLSTIKKNQIFGELALVDGSPRSANATVTTESEVILVSRHSLELQIEKLDDFMKFWIKHLTKQVRNLTQKLEE
jgi:CRP-like cAMP-binding protein